MATETSLHSVDDGVSTVSGQRSTPLSPAFTPITSSGLATSAPRLESFRELTVSISALIETTRHGTTSTICKTARCLLSGLGGDVVRQSNTPCPFRRAHK